MRRKPSPSWKRQSGYRCGKQLNSIFAAGERFYAGPVLD
jgi:hypothetical protein